MTELGRNLFSDSIKRDSSSAVAMQSGAGVLETINRADSKTREESSGEHEVSDCFTCYCRQGHAQAGFYRMVYCLYFAHVAYQIIYRCHIACLQNMRFAVFSVSLLQDFI